MTVLQPGSVLKRSISIPGVDKPVNIEITSAGLEFRVKGSRSSVFVSWYKTVQAGSTPVEVPSFLMGKPLELLQYQASKSKRKS